MPTYQSTWGCSLNTRSRLLSIVSRHVTHTLPNWRVSLRPLSRLSGTDDEGTMTLKENAASK